jgi:hypothetical protein
MFKVETRSVQIVYVKSPLYPPSLSPYFSSPRGVRSRYLGSIRADPGLSRVADLPQVLLETQSTKQLAPNKLKSPKMPNPTTAKNDPTGLAALRCVVGHKESGTEKSLKKEIVNLRRYLKMLARESKCFERMYRESRRQLWRSQQNRFLGPRMHEDATEGGERCCFCNEKPTLKSHRSDRYFGDISIHGVLPGESWEEYSERRGYRMVMTGYNLCDDCEDIHGILDNEIRIMYTHDGRGISIDGFVNAGTHLWIIS